MKRYSLQDEEKGVAVMKEKNKQVAVMNEKIKWNRSCILINSRSQKSLTCPHCWTDQRTERDFCYRCGAVFVYLDELKKPS